MVSEGGINEAHVPLPDGKTIPVDLGNFSGDLASGLKAMAAAISTLNSSLGGTTPVSNSDGLAGMLQNQFNEMLSEMRDHTDISKKLLNATL